MKLKKILSIFLAITIIFSLAACSAGNTQENTSEQSTSAPAQKIDVNTYVLNGPTGIGAVHMMNDAENGEGSENYNFTVAAAPDEVVAKISNNEADIAAVSTNLASTLYNKTNGGVKILAVNTMGVLYVLTNKGDEIESLKDLKGRTIFTTGQGANPEYIINYLLSENGIDPQKDVTIEYKAEGSELAGVWAQNPDAIIIAPQPVASTIAEKYEGSSLALDLTDEWEKTADGSELMMGCVVVRTQFLEEHPEAVEAFLSDYEKSINKVTEDIEATATLCEKYAIVPAAAVAKAAIPHCNICFVTGDEMKSKLTGYLEVLYKANPKSIGGAMPGDDFWYE